MHPTCQRNQAETLGHVRVRRPISCFLTVQQLPVEHGHSRHATNELEVGEVVLVAQAGVGVDLEGVVVPGITEFVVTV